MIAIFDIRKLQSIRHHPWAQSRKPDIIRSNLRYMADDPRIGFDFKEKNELEFWMEHRNKVIATFAERWAEAYIDGKKDLAFETVSGYLRILPFELAFELGDRNKLFEKARL